MKILLYKRQDYVFLSYECLCAVLDKIGEKKLEIPQPTLNFKVYNAHLVSPTSR